MKRAGGGNAVPPPRGLLDPGSDDLEIFARGAQLADSPEPRGVPRLSSLTKQVPQYRCRLSLSPASMALRTRVISAEFQCSKGFTASTEYDSGPDQQQSRNRPSAFEAISYQGDGHQAERSSFS